MKNKTKYLMVVLALFLSASCSKVEPQPKQEEDKTFIGKVNKGICKVNPWCLNDKK